MGLKIHWSNLAERKIRSIYDLLSFHVSPNYAKKLVLNIVKKVSILETNPYIGQKEDLLEDRAEEYRYLIITDYKIIYRIEGEKIIISTIFDCRQNPYKIKEVE